MKMDDRGVSELMGYTVIVAVVSIAAVGLLAGSMGALSANEKQMEYSGSVSAFKSFGDTVTSSIRSNNTYDTAYEMSIPEGFDLIVKDDQDDFRSLSIYMNSPQLAFLPFGSVVLRGAFRTVSYEGGAVISNDTGMVKAEKTPALHMVTLTSGKKALYISLVSISSDSFIRRGGHVTIFTKCGALRPMYWHITDGALVTLRVRSGDLQAWKEEMDACGLTTVYEDGDVSATSREVSDIYVAYSEAEIREG